MAEHFANLCEFSKAARAEIGSAIYIDEIAEVKRDGGEELVREKLAGLSRPCAAGNRRGRGKEAELRCES